MPDDLIPAELREFLARHVDSIAQLEALLLARSSPDDAWDGPTMAERLYLAEQEATETLAHLAEYGLLVRQGTGYRFGPQSSELMRLVDVLAHH
jgi:hypothetical protein